MFGLRFQDLNQKFLGVLGASAIPGFQAQWFVVFSLHSENGPPTIPKPYMEGRASEWGAVWDDVTSM